MLFIVFVICVVSASSIAAAGICLLDGYTPAQLFRSGPWRYGTVIVSVPSVVCGSVARLATSRWDIAICVASITAVLLLVWFRGKRKRAMRMMQPSERDVSEAVEDLRRRRPPEGETGILFETSVLSTARLLFHAGKLAPCAEILGFLNWSKLEPPLLVEGATTLTRCYLLSGLINEARKTLERARAHVAEHGDATAFAVLDAHILVHERKPNKALKLLPDAGATSAVLRLEALLVRIHAAAAKGEDEKALELIGALRKEGGPNALAWLKTPEGPATEMAASLGARNAYR